ncbi:MAG: DUF2169 domain-containing protein [Mariniblastus sp.]
MQLINGTKHCFAANQAYDKHGKMHLLAVVKATYDIPEFPNQKAAIADEQVPIFDADQFDGEPGVTAPVFESDWSLTKKRCDIVIKANGYSPGGNAVTELDVGFRVGDCEKAARIVGPRKWEKSNSKWLTPSQPEFFVEAPINYGNSFGGIWHDPMEGDFEIFTPNPVGRGYAVEFKNELEGQPLPMIEKPDEPISRSDQQYTPWAFGPMGRNWKPRAQMAGTYDEQWQETRFPFLPADFDEEYFQCTPADQQIEFPTGDEQVYLRNLHPTRPEIQFHLPKHLNMPMVALTQSQEQHAIIPVVDTVIIDVEKNQFSLVWRGHMPLKRSLRELNIVAVGHVCKKWWKAQVFGAKDCGCGGKESDPNKVISIGEALSDDE